MIKKIIILILLLLILFLGYNILRTPYLEQFGPGGGGRMVRCLDCQETPGRDCSQLCGTSSGGSSSSSGSSSSPSTTTSVAIPTSSVANPTTSVASPTSSVASPLTQSQSEWTQLGRDIDGESANDASGYSVSLSSDGNIVAIGSTWNNNFKGHVRIYRRDINKINAEVDQSSPDFGPIGWTRMGQDIDGITDRGRLGWSVSLSSDGRTIAIGAPADSFARDKSGEVNVYRWNGQRWSILGRTIDGQRQGDKCGWSVSLSSDGNTVALGAPKNNGNGTDSGNVRVFKFSF